MRNATTCEDATLAGVEEASEVARREPPRTGTLVLIARAAAHDRISAALRAGRARAGLDEQQVIDMLRVRGVAITPATLERWERTGGIRLEEAVDLAAVYHMSLDELAGRRAWHSRFLGTMDRARLDSA
jgi:hypothetical protein